MKIQIIGSGSMWNKNNSACYLIDDNIMIDFPNGACKYLYRIGIKPATIDYILLTHFHGDHYFDIPFFILNRSKNKSKNTNIYCSKEGKSKIKKIGNLAFPNSFKNACEGANVKYNFKEEFKINDYKITKLLVEHGRMKPAYGYIFDNQNVLLGFTGDTSLCKNVELMSSKCSYLFCDCMLLNGNSKHMGIDNIEYLSKKYPNCNFVVSHLEDETRDRLNKIKLKNIIVPEDYKILLIDKS